MSSKSRLAPEAPLSTAGGGETARSSPWLVGCQGFRTTHTYPAAGSYTARLEVRNCEDPVQTSANFVITVTEQPQLAVLVFEAFCPLGFCLFETDEPVFFTTLVQGQPTVYAYDWNGDGLTDELGPAGLQATATLSPAPTRRA